MALPTHNRVAVYYTNRDLRLENRPIPAPGRGEILVAVHASGICGSDLLEWYRRPKAPAVLGHEVAGRVVAVGDDVDRYRTNGRVVVTHHVPCLDCRYCRSGRETMCDMLRKTNFDPGGFAAYIRVPAPNVQRGALTIPDHVSDDAASFVEPLGCVLRGQRKAGISEGDTILILGAGVSGILHMLAARARNARKIFVSDIQPARRRLAEDLGADRVLDAGDAVPQLIRRDLGHGADCVIVCTGARGAVDQALAAADRGGTVLFFAPMGPDQTLPLPFDTVFWRNDVTLTSSYGAAPRDLEAALSLIASGQTGVERLVTHRLPLEEIQRGFDMALDGRESLKIIVDPRIDGSLASAPPDGSV